MKNSIEKEDIPELAARIPFEQLSEQEQEQILILLGDKQAYISLTQAVEKSRELLQLELNAEPLPQKAPALLHSALQRRSRFSVPVLFRPIPLYQAGIAIAATIACLFFMLPQQQKPSTTNTALIHPQSPTIIVQTINKDSLVSLLRDSLQYVLSKKVSLAKDQAQSPRHYDYNTPSEQIALHDTTEEKPKNPFVGLDNMDIVLSQKKGIPSNAHYAIAKFTYRQKTER